LADLQRTVYPHSGHPLAEGRAQDRVSSPAKDRRSANCATELSISLARPCQPSIPPGSVNEYQLRLGRQRQVWFILLGLHFISWVRCTFVLAVTNRLRESLYAVNSFLWQLTLHAAFAWVYFVSSTSPPHGFAWHADCLSCAAIVCTWWVWFRVYWWLARHQIQICRDRNTWGLLRGKMWLEIGNVAKFYSASRW